MSTEFVMKIIVHKQTGEHVLLMQIEGIEILFSIEEAAEFFSKLGSAIQLMFEGNQKQKELQEKTGLSSEAVAKFLNEDSPNKVN